MKSILAMIANTHIAKRSHLGCMEGISQEGLQHVHVPSESDHVQYRG